MAIIELFSTKQKMLRGEMPDIYQYSELPHTLKVQISQIIGDAIGSNRVNDYNEQRNASNIFDFIQKTLCREYGTSYLYDSSDDSDEDVLNFFMNAKNIEQQLDVIQICFQLINISVREKYHVYAQLNDVSATPDDAIEELNVRFKQHGVGYQFESNEIIRVDSTYVHAEIVKPTLVLLSSRTFSGANEEYLKAHDHYRHGRNKECLAECLKALESVLKIICKEKGWSFNATDTAKKLIQVCFQNNLVPTFTQNQFTSLENLIVSGVPTVRNKLGGHGQGQVPQSVDDGMARYALNLTGSNIIFLIEQSGL